MDVTHRIDASLFAAPAFSLALGPDGELRFDGLNDLVCDLSGLKREDMIGRTPLECLPYDAAVHVEAHYRQCIDVRGPYEYESHLDLPGRAKWWRTTLSPLIDSSTNNVVGVFGLTMDVTDRKLVELELRDVAFKDPLTGICNRRRFDRDIQNAVARANQTGDRFAVVLADVDRFKSINDRYGHPAGDAALKEIASRLAKAVRDTDRLARIGGDEFAAIVVAGNDEAMSGALRRILDGLSGPISVPGHILNVRVSLGAALWCEGMTAATVIAAADAAMYRQKETRAA